MNKYIKWRTTTTKGMNMLKQASLSHPCLVPLQVYLPFTLSHWVTLVPFLYTWQISTIFLKLFPPFKIQNSACLPPNLACLQDVPQTVLSQILFTWPTYPPALNCDWLSTACHQESLPQNAGWINERPQRKPTIIVLTKHLWIETLKQQQQQKKVPIYLEIYIERAIVTKWQKKVKDTVIREHSMCWDSQRRWKRA